MDEGPRGLLKRKGESHLSGISLRVIRRVPLMARKPNKEGISSRYNLDTTRLRVVGGSAALTIVATLPPSELL